MRLLAAAALAFAVALPAAGAEDAVSPARLALAKQVMELNGSAAAYADYGKNLDRMVEQLRQSMPGADDATIADIKKIAVEEFDAYRPTLIDGVVRVYAKHFSERDLKALVAFYKSDAGKHFAAEIPAVSQECMDLTAPFMTRFLERIREYIRAKIAAEAAKTPPEAPAPKDAPKDESKTK
jgi:hypothetical protein